MEVRGKIKAPASLRLGKESPVVTELESGWTPEPVSTL